MKRLVCLLALVWIGGKGIAQTDSTTANTDTVKVGNFIIIKKNKGKTVTENTDRRLNNSFEFKVERRARKRSNISTNWWIMDLGFANMRDQTDYTPAQAGNYLKVFRPADGAVNQNSFKLINGKSSNVNIWFFMQKLNVSKHVVNLKYGLGMEMYNYRFDTRLSYRKDPQPYAFNDSIGFSKNKLFVSYLTVPFMINFNTTPDSRRGLSFSAGVSAGYLLNSRNKQISSERGKQKIKGDFNFEPWRLATIAEIGLGPVRLYGSYSLNRLQRDITRIEQYPYTVGIRLSNW
ncbi:MAG: outer membrane beta-barrel protein [Sediminibacterium sp.]|nr:outer membrane beta-barrel protein [Sediminibacterium sp.]MDP3127693.1 outer membrane beta-barrel protein [Sediminibacterium sp.]